MTNTTGPELTDAQVERRAEIVDGVDDPDCQRCGASAIEAGAATDPEWFVDTLLTPNPGHAKHPMEVGILFCPTCW